MIVNSRGLQSFVVCYWPCFPLGHAILLGRPLTHGLLMVSRCGRLDVNILTKQSPSSVGPDAIDYVDPSLSAFLR